MAKLREFDRGARLTDDEAVAEYVTAALEDPNPDVFPAAVGNVAKARGMSSIAEASGLGRESLYGAAESRRQTFRHRGLTSSSRRMEPDA